MSSFIDLTGRVFGRLTVLGPHKREGHATYWKCRCSCDKKTEKYIYVSSLTTGVTQSCGCIRVEGMVARCTKHNKAHTLIYSLWQSMKDRCCNPQNAYYKDYGGRGIYVAPPWLDFNVFYKDMGDRPPQRSLGRIDNDGPYCKENCRWETSKEQANNTRMTVRLTYKGETKTLHEWAEELDIHPGTIQSRLVRGRTMDEVFSHFSPGMNTRKDATMVEFGGEMRPLTEVAHQLGLSPKLLQTRLCKGWRGERLFSPLMKRGGHNNPRYIEKLKNKEKPV